MDKIETRQIIIKLIGGLGNQMFQIAYGKALAKKYNVDLKIDLSFYDENSNSKNKQKRIYELAIFDMDISIANKKEIMHLTYRTPFSYFNKIINKLLGTRSQHIIENKSSSDIKQLLTSSNVYIEGFWQSEFFFNNIKEEIKQIFIFKKEISFESNEILNKIKTTNSISIHIRRGDYIEIKKNIKTYATCSINYYLEAIKLIESKVNNPVFYIFTDDKIWVKENFATDKKIEIVDCNKYPNNWMDMMLMSYCKHNIIANSTFSWWGAWLNSNSNKIVIAPQKWYNNKEDETNNLIPENWIKIQNS